jgi:regulator of cell morphogenesis and NO signaling
MLALNRTATAAPIVAEQPARAADGSHYLPDAALVAHIVEHHAYARRALPYIVALLAKVAAFHGKRNRKLSDLCDTGSALADALEDHLEAEERGLFPALLTGAVRRELVRRELGQMCRHHREVRLLLGRVRALADGYAAPAWGSRGYQVLMEELEALEEDVLEHLHLEKYVLIPRVSSRCVSAC